MINKKISNEFQNNGVVLLKKIIDQKWIEELRKGIEYNFCLLYTSPSPRDS